MPYGEVGRGIDDLKVAVLTADTPGAMVDVPGAQQFSLNVVSETDEVKGDNTVIAKVRGAKSLEGTIGIARINLAALAAMIGGTPGTSGSTPNIILSLNESDTPISRFFQAIGQTTSWDAGGSGYRLLAKKLSVAGGPDESMTIDEFNTPTLDVEGTGISGVLLVRYNQETAINPIV